MKKVVIFGLLAVFGATGSLWAGTTVEGTTMEEMLKKSENGMLGQDEVLFDVRTPEEFKEGHIKGAINVPLDDMEPSKFKASGKKKILLYCRSGRRSALAAGKLKNWGIEAYNLGGIMKWQELGGKLEKEEGPSSKKTKPQTSKSQKTKPEEKSKEPVLTNQSGNMPENFIIPRGLCETLEPAQIFGKDPKDFNKPQK